MSQQRTTPNHSGNAEHAGHVSFKDFGRTSYLALTRLQDWAEEQTVEADRGKVLIGDLRHRVLVIDQEDDPAIILSCEVAHPQGVGDLTWMTFRACSYALYTVCRENVRGRLVHDGPRRYVPRGVEEQAEMNIADTVMRVTVHVLELA